MKNFSYFVPLPKSLYYLILLSKYGHIIFLRSKILFLNVKYKYSIFNISIGYTQLIKIWIFNNQSKVPIKTESLSRVRKRRIHWIRKCIFRSHKLSKRNTDSLPFEIKYLFELSITYSGHSLLMLILTRV